MLTREEAPLVSGPLHRAQLDHAQRQVNPHRRGRQPFRILKALPETTPKLWISREKAAFGYGDQTLVEDIPDDAWRYQLGTKSAMEWVVDQYKDRTPKDPTIRAQFDTYRVADHLEEVTLLLRKVITVSLETMKVVDRLAAISPLNPHSDAKPTHQQPAPATPQAARQLLLDFSGPTEPLPPPATFTLALTRSQSDFYLQWLHTEREGNALECLLDAHGHGWDSRVSCYDVTQYWQGPKGLPGSWIVSLVVTPD